jgi:rhodanese-related sulfurtransferase
MLRVLYEDYLRETKDNWNYILPTELNNFIKKGDTSNLYLLDIRKSEDFDKGHIPGTVNIFWLNVLNPENMKKLPVDKEIILICYLGHTSSQLLVMLSTLGYHCRSLKFGMGKSPDPDVKIKSWLDYGFPIV